MAAKPLPSQLELLQLLRYEPETGKLFWRERGMEMFPAKTPRRSQSLCALWNHRYADHEAFTAISDGYKTGAILGQNYKAHRVIWKMIHGEDPDRVDHEFGERTDNRIEKLSDVSLTQNARNRKLPSNNKSGVIGVYRWRQGPYACWAARVGPKKYAYFQSFDDAVRARLAAEVKYGFHENHGRA